MTAPKEYIRPEVMAFAYAMENTLRKHDNKKGDSYKTCDVDYLLMRLREEVKELHDQIQHEEEQGTLRARKNSFAEAVDVGDIAMMIAYRKVSDLDWYLRSRPHTPAPVPEENKLVSTSLKYRDVDSLDNIKKQERERVLDELILWCKMEAKIYSQYYLTESGYDILATLEQHLESLRESGEG